MKTVIAFSLLILIASCGVKVPYTNDVRDEFGLDSEKEAKKVQFYTIIPPNFRTAS